MAHAWLEVDGRVLDVCSDGLALCEAARRAGIDYSDEPAMEELFGRDAETGVGARGGIRGSTSHLFLSRFCHWNTLKPPNVSLKECSRPAGNQTSVCPW